MTLFPTGFSTVNRNSLRSFWLTAAFGLLAVTTLAAQSGTTGAIAGKVTDPRDAIIAGAKITVTNTANGQVRTTTTTADGNYLVPLLPPGSYTVTAGQTGFSALKRGPIDVATSSTMNVDFKLSVGSAAQTVEVQSQAQLIEVENPNITTVLDTTAIVNQPNPGGDLAFFAQIAPGAVTARPGTGTTGLAFNGQVTNNIGYTMDGMDDNEPFVGGNNGGASDMTLGANATAEVSVNTNAYSADQGRFSAANVEYTSKSGNNEYHGNLQYQWNGRVLNAYDFFVKANPLAAGQTLPPKPFDNVNNFAASIGGPIKKNKLFFFFDIEGDRIDLPEVLTGTVPTPAFIAYSQSELALGGCDTTGAILANSAPTGYPAAGAKCIDPQSNGSNNYEKYLPPETGANANGINELPYLQSIYKLFGGIPGTTAAGSYGNILITNPATNTQTGCPLQQATDQTSTPTVDAAFNPQMAYTTAASASASGAAKNGSNPIPADAGCVNSVTYDAHNRTPETITSIRMDYTRDQQNTFWFRFMNDSSLQATSTSLLGPIFNATSNQPYRYGWFDWTHTFSGTLVNDFTSSGFWYSNIFEAGNDGVADLPQILTTLDGVGSFGSPFTTVGSSGTSGRVVTQLQAVDNLTWTHGAHSVKIGANWRREIISDWGLDTANSPSTTASTDAQLMFGVANTAAIKFPVASVQPLDDWSLDAYISDTWQIAHNLTMISGLRLTYNSNLVDPFGYFADAQEWPTFSHGIAAVSTAQNTLVKGSTNYWNSVPTIVPQPRLSFSYEPRNNTVIKAGWGMFTQVPIPNVANTLLALPPFDPSFTGGQGGQGVFGGSVGCPDFVPQSALGGIQNQCYTLLDPGNSLSALNGARAQYAPYIANYNAGNPSCAALSINGQASTTTCVPVGALSAFPQAGLAPPMLYQYSLSIQHQFGRNISLQTGYVGNRAQHTPIIFDPNGYESVCSGCFAPLPFAGAKNFAGGSVVSTSLAGCATQTPTTCDPDPRFSAFSQYEYDGRSRYDSLQTTLHDRMTAGLTLTLNYTWSHCLNHIAGFELNSGTAYQDCSIDTRSALNAGYTYMLPIHTKNAMLGKAINDWQVSGITFAESGVPIFVGGASNGQIVQATGPISAAIPIAGQSPYAKGQFIPYITKVDTAGQWFNPVAFASVWDGSTKSCYNPGTPPANILGGPTFGFGSEAINPTNCQFPQNYAMTFDGPLFNWTDFYVSKTLKLTERINFRFDAQFYNLFNHVNFAPPTITGGIYQSGTVNANTNPYGYNSSIVGAGALTADTQPPDSLLGSELGGNAAPRMIAFQGKIVF